MANKPMKLPPDILRDILFFGGAALVAFGAGLIYLPAGFIVAGLVLSAVGILPLILRARQ
jgi:hypothetical protein